jgi:hypothetical protein
MVFPIKLSTCEVQCSQLSLEEQAESSRKDKERRITREKNDEDEGDGGLWWSWERKGRKVRVCGRERNKRARRLKGEAGKKKKSV